MSQPRAVVPGRIYMITRRCSERRFFLRPCPKSNNAFIYCLAIAAQKYGVQVIFTATMSNHHHTGIIDVLGTLPDFLAHFHKLFAKHQNALYGRWESMWASHQTSAVELVGADDVFAKMVYALVNPVAGHIVEKVQHWPGVNSLGATVTGTALTAKRPETFFRPDGNMPEQVSLPLTLLPEWSGAARPQFIARLNESIGDAERSAAAARKASNSAIVGRDVVLRQHWNDRPTTKEPKRQLNPRVACCDIRRRIEVLARNTTWLQAYREARDKFTGGFAVTFPAGTFWLRRFAGVFCEPYAPS